MATIKALFLTAILIGVWLVGPLLVALAGSILLVLVLRHMFKQAKEPEELDNDWDKFIS